MWFLSAILLGAAGPIITPHGGGPGFAATGACASMASGDVCCYDADGVRCGFPVTDALADDLRIYGHSASPIGAGANLVGQDILVAGGQGSMTLVATVANCGAGDTVSVTVDGTTSTCTRDAATDSSTLFTCGATNAAMATNIAACLNLQTGVDACAGAGCTLFTGVAGTAYVYRDSLEAGGGKTSVASSGDHAVAANGLDGAIRWQGPTALLTVTIAADDLTPSVNGGNVFVTSANTGATAISDLDDPTVGQVVTICGGSDTNSSTIADSGNFALNSAFTASLDACIDLWVQADNDYIELGRTAAGGWVGTATSNLDMSTFAVLFGTDPADAGDIRLENATTVCWEASPAGTDQCLNVDASEVLSYTGAVEITGQAGGDVADSGDLRFRNSGQMCWETSPAASAQCIYLDATENLVVDMPIAISASNPADAGSLRLDNNEGIGWEASPAGTDVLLNVTTGEALTVTGASDVTTNSTITSTRTTDIGWAVVSGADTACNTTCTNACVFGVNTASLVADIVDCADATADECLCAGGS